MIFRAETQYGLRIMAAMSQCGMRCSAPQLAETTGIAAPSVAKVVQRLALNKLVHGHAGRGGGYELGRPANEISLMDVVRIWEGDDFGTQCILGFPHCDEDNTCGFHDAWGSIRGQLVDMLQNTTVASLAAGDVDLP